MKITISGIEGREDIVIEEVHQFMILTEVPGSYRTEVAAKPAFRAYAAMAMLKLAWEAE